MKFALVISLCLMHNLVHNVLIPISGTYMVGACTALRYPFDTIRQASQACWGLAGVSFPWSWIGIVF